MSHPLMAELRAQSAPPTDNPCPPWCEVLESFRSAMLAGGRRVSTWWTYSTHLRRLAVASPAGPATVQPADLAHWLEEGYAGCAEDTRKNAATAARAFYGWAYEVGLVESEPAARLAGRKLRPHDGRVPEAVAASGRALCRRRQRR